MRLILISKNRYNKSHRLTMGEMYIDSLLVCVTLELAWKDNEVNVSCIPKGRYDISAWYSQKFKQRVIAIENVEGRTFIEIHSANYVRQLRGCVTVGEHYRDIDGDGLKDVVSSRVALKNLVKLVDNNSITELIVV